MLDSLVNELSSEGLFVDGTNTSQNALLAPQQAQTPTTRIINRRGPIIADVTDEMTELSTNTSPSGARGGNVGGRYSISGKREIYSTTNSNYGNNSRKIITPFVQSSNYSPQQQTMHPTRYVNNRYQVRYL